MRTALMACGVSYFFPGNGFCFAIGYLLLFLPVADADNTPLYSYAGRNGDSYIHTAVERMMLVRLLGA